jgi:hypothetical protein
MPIYEYYCRDNHTIYQFYAKTLAQGKIVPKCPADPRYRMEKVLSSFAVTSGRPESPSQERANEPELTPQDSRSAAAEAEVAKEFANFNEEDPKAMGRMLRRMAELSGEKIDGQIEEVVRKLEEGTDPEALEEQLGDDDSGPLEDPAGPEAAERERKEARQRFRARRAAPVRDPTLYDYD